MCGRGPASVDLEPFLNFFFGLFLWALVFFLAAGFFLATRGVLGDDWVLQEVEEKDGTEYRLPLMLCAAPIAALAMMHVVPIIASAGAAATAAPRTVQATGMANMLPPIRDLQTTATI